MDEEVRRFVSADGRRRVIVLRRPDGHFAYETQSWHRYYEPSAEDSTAPVDGPGLWDGNRSGIFATAEAAEADARITVAWLADC